MKFSRVIITIIVIALAVIIFSTVSFGPDNRQYVEMILKERKEKDEFMQSSETSPFKNDKSTFEHLNYFEPDPKYVITAKLVPVENRRVVLISTNTGDAVNYLEYAWAEFTLDQKPCRLLILEGMGGGVRGTLFLGFTDETSGGETYGAGRYLELKKAPGQSTVLLDFNKAYNPYCAYSNDYTCPFPPRENILPVSIRAGEKNYH